MTAARVLLSVVLMELAGLALLSRLGRERRSGPGALGMAYAVGVLATALWTYLLLWIRVPVTLLTVLAGPVAMAACGRWGYWRELVWKRPPWPAVLIAGAAVFLICGAFSWPLLGVDPDVFYLFKAKSIAHHGTIWTDDFLDPDRLHSAHRRPLLLPAIYADLALLSGVWHGPLLRAWFALLQIGAGVALYDVLRARVDRSAAALGTAVYAWLPVLWHDSGGAVSAYGDAPLAMLFLFALTCETRLSILFVTAAVLVKEDAMAFLVPYALLRGWRPALLPGAVAVAWMMTTAFLPLDEEYYANRFLNPNFGNLVFGIRKIVSELGALKHWGLLWVLSALAFALRARKLDRQDLRWLFPALFQMAAYVGVWMTFDPSVAQFYIRMQDMRLLLHVTPLVWVWAVWRGRELSLGTQPSGPR